MFLPKLHLSTESEESTKPVEQPQKLPPKLPSIRGKPFQLFRAFGFAYGTGQMLVKKQGSSLTVIESFLPETIDSLVTTKPFEYKKIVIPNEAFETGQVLVADVSGSKSTEPQITLTDLSGHPVFKSWKGCRPWSLDYHQLELKLDDEQRAALTAFTGFAAAWQRKNKKSMEQVKHTSKTPKKSGRFSLRRTFGDGCGIGQLLVRSEKGKVLEVLEIYLPDSLIPPLPERLIQYTQVEVDGNRTKGAQIWIAEISVSQEFGPEISLLDLSGKTIDRPRPLDPDRVRLNISQPHQEALAAFTGVEGPWIPVAFHPGVEKALQAVRHPQFERKPHHRASSLGNMFEQAHLILRSSAR